jgi:signal transduction histidine kinase
MLSHLTLRWRLTLLHTGVFLVVGALVVTMVYLQNRIVVRRVGVIPAYQMDGVSYPTQRAAQWSPAQTINAIDLQRDDAIGTILIEWIVALAVMTLLVGLLAWWVTGRVLKRVHAMTAQARHISLANLHERLSVPGPADEIKELSETFNDMLGRLDEAFNSQARFIANASHELRTPLAVARTTLQVGLASTDPARVRRVREELLRNNDHCIALINGLLTLAHGEQGRPHRESVDFDDVVNAVLTETAAAHPRDDPRLLFDEVEPCTVSGDPVLLAQLVRNLVDNAVRYNVPGGEVRVRLDAHGRLTISNTGPTITEDEADRLFEPFFRGTGRAGRTDGAGLGLSIVRAVAASFGGRAGARPLSAGGLAVEVRLPASGPADRARPNGSRPGAAAAAP